HMGSLKALRPIVSKIHIDKWLSFFNLESMRYSKIKTLSIGTQQKISIIQALLNDPEILILDEPTTNLDPIERNHLLKLLSQLSREKIIIYSTHIVSDIESFTKNVIILKNGEVVQSGTISELIASIPLPIWTTRLFPENYTDAANQLKIINHISNGKEVIIKSISDTPPYATSQRATPTLEDCYLYILNS
ncbi:MAG: ATP-binding cassette domain-containing protein, partial [Lachnospiraceae bacterium]|nr:ATP-binding cassette domain-containing protein [Lachnospiraceae bacterium]